MSMKMRTESDSMGELEVPADALWGAQTQRAVNNFPISGLCVPRGFIKALGLIKASAARANAQLGLLDSAMAEAIAEAALVVARGKYDRQFPVDIFQTGSGTSSNMNANEVIARLASKASGLEIHPNDHVNLGQSSNDVIPTAIQVSAVLAVNERLLPSLAYLAETIDIKSEEESGVVKTGRTHLMDAVPITLERELKGWSAQIRSNVKRIKSALKRLRKLPQGGTAVGTGLNAHVDFRYMFVAELNRYTGIRFKAIDDPIEGIASQDSSVELSGQMKTLACTLMKISNDLRLMNSGPLSGLGEIRLPVLQPGSSIMPGKVNPVIPEAVAMVCAQVIGNDSTITIAGQSGLFQLNVMLPVIAYNLLQSIELMSSSTRLLADQAISGFEVCEEHLAKTLGRNPILVTALNPVIGYELGAKIAKQAYQQGRPVIDVAAELTDLSETELKKLLDPMTLAKGGLVG